MIVSSQNYFRHRKLDPSQYVSRRIVVAISNYLRLYNSISPSLTVDLQSCEMERNSCEIGSRSGITRRRKEPPNYIIHFRDPPISITIKRAASSGHRRSINQPPNFGRWFRAKKKRSKQLERSSGVVRVYCLYAHANVESIADYLTKSEWFEKFGMMVVTLSSFLEEDWRSAERRTMTKRERELAGDRSLRTWERLVSTAAYIYTTRRATSGIVATSSERLFYRVNLGTKEPKFVLLALCAHL